MLDCIQDLGLGGIEIPKILGGGGDALWKYKYIEMGRGRGDAALCMHVCKCMHAYVCVNFTLKKHAHPYHLARRFIKCISSCSLQS